MELDPTTEAPLESASQGISYLLVRFIVALAWWGAVLIAPLGFLFLVFGGGQLRFAVPVEISPEGPVLEVRSAAPRDFAVHLDDLSAELVLPAGELGAATWLGLLGLYGGAVFILAQVRGVVASLRSRPFVRANARRLARIGWALLLLNLAKPALAAWQHDHLAGLVAVSGGRVGISAGIELSDLAYPLILLVLAQVFRIGASLERERSLVI